MRGPGQVLAVLNRLHVFQQLAQREGKIGVGKAVNAQIGESLPLGVEPSAGVELVAGGRLFGLPDETIYHCIDRVRLVGLNLEFELHAVGLKRAELGGGREELKNLLHIDLGAVGGVTRIAEDNL